MSHSFTKLLVHITFHVKSNTILIRDEDEAHLYAYIGSVLKSDNCIPVKINGVADHLHILCVIPATIRLAKVVENIKRHSSRWIKSRGDHYACFAWQRGYAAFSASASNHDALVRYIENQKQHHFRMTSLQEYEGFLKKHDLVE